MNARKNLLIYFCKARLDQVAWGDPKHGGDTSEVQHDLHSVQQIQSTQTAFAALRTDGAVISWGDDFGGGDSFDVQQQLRNVREIQAGLGKILFEQPDPIAPFRRDTKRSPLKHWSNARRLQP